MSKSPEAKAQQVAQVDAAKARAPQAKRWAGKVKP